LRDSLQLFKCSQNKSSLRIETTPTSVSLVYPAIFSENSMLTTLADVWIGSGDLCRRDRTRRVPKPELVQDIPLSSSVDPSALFELWSEGLLCDVVCEAADGSSFNAHMVVLAASSAFFRALFAGAGAHMQEGKGFGGPRRVVLPGISGETLRDILTSLYTRSLRVRTS